MAEDAGTVLECFINDVANLPAEVNHLFEEMHAKEKQLVECQKSIAQRDSALQKVIRANNGTHVHNPKEDQYVAVIRKHYATADRLQEEKVALAQKAFDLIDRHIRRLNSKIRTLQSDGLFPQDPSPPPTARPTPSRVHSRASPSTTRPSIPSYLQSSIRASSPHVSSHDRKRPRVSEASANTPHITSETSARSGTPSTSHQKRGVRNSSHRERDRKRKRKEREETDEDVEEEDEEDGADDKRLYCTCNEVSYGNMVGCDNPDCAYEWFHWSCVGITKEPAGAWYCEECKVKLGK
ncbi:hypothetical protein BJ508DRAFT_19972 [Ascobolus immersus RN42]|uniref:Chromatin modification-related protein n=1 Tax=Ascobolus immersus RN42 TaxID=1160509 RepID=A0A3N4IL95_ASCIM|nr:hypothetical protein BJ508DRAFT_19972 [Ascobolus immersus RN42]